MLKVKENIKQEISDITEKQTSNNDNEIIQNKTLNDCEIIINKLIKKNEFKEFQSELKVKPFKNQEYFNKRFNYFKWGLIKPKEIIDKKNYLKYNALVYLIVTIPLLFFIFFFKIFNIVFLILISSAIYAFVINDTLLDIRNIASLNEINKSNLSEEYVLSQTKFIEPNSFNETIFNMTTLFLYYKIPTFHINSLNKYYEYSILNTEFQCEKLLNNTPMPNEEITLYYKILSYLDNIENFQIKDKQIIKEQINDLFYKPLLDIQKNNLIQDYIMDNEINEIKQNLNQIFNPKQEHSIQLEECLDKLNDNYKISLLNNELNGVTNIEISNSLAKKKKENVLQVINDIRHSLFVIKQIKEQNPTITIYMSNEEYHLITKSQDFQQLKNEIETIMKNTLKTFAQKNYSS